MQHNLSRGLLCLFGMFIFCCSAYAEGDDKLTVSDGKVYLYRLFLTDKKGTPYSLDKPQQFLSSKSLERRRKQGIAVDSTDLPVCPSYIMQISGTEDVEVISKSKWNNTVLVKVSSKSTVKSLEALPFVRVAEKVFTAPDSLGIAVRSQYSEELETKSNQGDTYGAAATNIDLLNGRKMHEMGYRGRGMTIAVVDGGFMNVDRIPAMKKIRILGAKDFVALYPADIYTEHDHGTRVLSTMALNEEGLFVGTAPEAEYWILRAEDTHTESLAEEDYWAAAVEFADSVGADIVSSSLGYQEFDDKETSHKYYELDGNHALISKTASLLAYKGIIHVNSAGNAGMGTWKKINFPADATNILAVGAVNSKGVNATFSSVGPSDDGRVKPDIVALGSFTAVVNGKGKQQNDMGTSFACPTIAGMVACLWQSAPGKTAFEVMDAVRKSGDNYETPNNVFGYGIPDFMKAYSILRGK